MKKQRLILSILCLISVVVIVAIIMIFYYGDRSDRESKVYSPNVSLPNSASAPSQKKQDLLNIDQVEKNVLPGVEYTASNRRDPFMPLIVKPDLKGKDIAISQIKLIGIIWDESNYYAVLMLPDGKYYSLKENMRLPMYSAFVHKITKDSVTIKKEIKIKKGAIKTEDITLKLRKEEDG
jgi:type II secretory pathway component PulC